MWLESPSIYAHEGGLIKRNEPLTESIAINGTKHNKMKSTHKLLY